MLRKVCALFLVYIVALYPTLSLAAAPQIPGFYGKVSLPQPTPVQLPVLLQGGTQQGVGQGVYTISTSNHLIVNQTAPQAIIDWQSFNIGANAWTHFDQQGNKSWVALNRIYDKDPTQIFGKLTADGKIYLINQNGILFGQGSQVNVHSLVASALNITKEDFLKGVMKFQSPPTAIPVVVSNHGTITTDDVGSVFLLGPQVENYGSITAPVGQIGLAAGTDIELSNDPTGARSALIVNVKINPGSTTNADGASLTADTGLIGMYGQDVNQNGLIRSVTAVRKNGQIELFAANKVTMGANSLISSPVSASTESVDESFTFHGGKVTVGGLDPAHPANPQTPVKQIELYGAIEAPSGTVTMQAEQRIYLESGSSINVAGSWLDKEASTSAVTATLNTVTLNDDHGQKGGVLQGQRITVDPASGSAIGNVQGSLLVSDKTALERSVQGGAITLQVNSGDLIAKQGSLLDFSGGGIRYGSGAYGTTKLLTGNTVFDISNASEWATYSKVLGDQKTVTNKYGKTGEYLGLYFGGGSSVLDLKPGFVQGADAGKLSVSAPQVVLDAQMDGSATAGVYQTKMLRADISNAAGTEMPLGGSLTVGTPNSGTYSDLVVNSIEVKTDTEAASGTAATLPIATTAPTTLSARNLNSAGLSSLSLYANTGLTIEKGAELYLSQGGSLIAQSRQINDQGGITIPGGNVSFTTSDNITSNSQSPRYQEIAQGLFLDEGSRIDVAGLKIDNSLSGKGAAIPFVSGRTTGGAISLQDVTIGGNGSVIVKEGASLEVSGGYQIDPKGKISGGDAGTLAIEGHTVIVDGTLRGLSLPGTKGGKISLHADEVDLVAATPDPLNITAGAQIPVDRFGKLMLGADQLDSTGFSRVALLSENDINFNSQFTPSMVKMAVPVSAMGGSSGQLTVNNTTFSGSDPLSPDFVGVTSVTATTGLQFPKPLNYANPENYNPQLTVAVGAGITVAPGGTVSLQADAIKMAGLISAPAGQVSLTATQGGVTVTGAGKILAAGYVKPGSTSLASGLATDSTPLAGGSLNLTASNGSLTFESGSLVDVSGSGPVTRNVTNADGTVATVSVGSDAGSVSLAYGTALTLNGKLNGQSDMQRTKGGTLNISTGSALNVSGSYLDWYTKSGFDALTLKSASGLNLTGAMNYLVNRSLTLDAPVIKGDGSVQTLLSPWITLQNTNTGSSPVSGNGATGTSQLNLVGEWIDIQGALQLSGFNKVSLAAQNDIRLSDLQYGSNKEWQGSLGMTGNLTLKASRIYPTTLADFTINVANYKDNSGKTSGGNATILPGNDQGVGTILSAGGRLAIKAATGIDVQGVIAAPMGQIELDAPNGRVYLGEKSVLSTVGTVPVAYGALDDVFWTYLARTATNNGTTAITAAPGKAVTINGKEVITREGSTIEVSGGGSILGYQFIPGVEGSVNPFSVKGRYIIISDQSVSLPGNAVYLSGGNGIKAGVYSILPEQYAFLPGAMIITDLGTIAKPGMSQLSLEGYPLVTGYATVNGTGIASSQLKNYSIRSAADVMKEGHFSTREITAGDAGAVALLGTTTIVNGVIKAEALPATVDYTYSGGSMDLSGRNVTITPATNTSLPQDFSFTTAIPDAQAGTLQIAAAAVSGKGLKQLNLGDQNTATVTVQTGSVLEVQNITIAAQNAIVVEHDAQILGIVPIPQSGAAGSDSGTVTMAAPQGKVTVGINAVVHAADSVTLDTRAMDIQGRLTADKGLLNLGSENIFFVSDAFLAANPGIVSSNPGLSITNSIWNSFSGFSNLTLKSGSDIGFQGDFNLQVADRLTMDALRIAGQGSITGTTITGKNIALQNSGTQTSSSAVAVEAGSITLSADQISVGRGNVRIAGFSQANLNSKSDLTMRGDGSLIVDRDLNLSAARITAAATKPSAAAGNAAYIPANFTLDASNGTVVITKSGGAAGTATMTGGFLTIKAQGVDDSGVIDLPAGKVTISSGAAGIDSGIVLHSGAAILAQGSSTPTANPDIFDSAPGGVVTLTTSKAPVTLESGSLIDVSATGNGDAGSITLQSLQGGVNIAGTLTGSSPRGKGGSLSLATDSLATVNGENRFTSLAGKLAAGGFSGDVGLRARTGDVTIDGNTTVKADNLRLTVDSGSLKINGSIDISGGKRGGSAELFAGNNLVLAAGSSIDARGTGSGASGGDLVLGIAAGSIGTIDFGTDATINVSGTTDASGNGGVGGTVTFRAPRNSGNTDVNMSLVGTVSGSSNVDAIGVSSYVNDFSTWQSDATTFISNANVTAVKGNMTLDPGTQFSLLPGVEIISTGNMTLNDSMDLTMMRYGDDKVPGELTLRAGGNLTIAGSLIDAPGISDRSGGINLAAGADLTSADYLASNHNRQGTLTIADGTAVYTANASLRFASGNDTSIGTLYTDSNLTGVYGLNYTRFNLGTYGGDVSGRVGGNLVLNGGAIQSATGNLDINVGGDLYLYTPSVSMGSIRTTGEYLADSTQSWNYANGGNITLSTKGSVYGGLNTGAWDRINDVNGDGIVSAWSASYGDDNGANPTEGLATMGGGNVTIRTGGSFSGQSGTFGVGDLTVYAGNDLGGHFLVKNGNGVLNSMGNIGMDSPLVIDAFAARLNIASQGNIELGTVLNPTIVRQSEAGTVPWNLQYSQNSSVSLAAAKGDVTIWGATPSSLQNGSAPIEEAVLPPTLEVYAGHDINLQAEYLDLAPSPTGNLRLVAGNDINGGYTSNSGLAKRSTLNMLDMNPEDIYGEQSDFNVNNLKTKGLHGDKPVHLGDANPVEITAGNDIKNLSLYLPKQTEIKAGRDIRDIYYFGQNLPNADGTDAGNVSKIVAGGNISFSNLKDTSAYTGIDQGGPGYLLAQAGNSIDLGTTKGIQTYGNAINPALGNKGADLAVVAGSTKDITDVATFFTNLRQAGVEYSELQTKGETDKALERITQARNDIINPFFDAPVNDGKGGNISMTDSQISTVGGKDDLFIIARGQVDVGKTTFKQDTDTRSTGIFTAAGGAINAFTGGDLNVNESRLMTFMGGDITLWSDQGNINAGRGSKTAVSASPPKITIIDGNPVVMFQPPAVGSGIRAVTFDPDGLEGPLLAPPAGDIYVFAPKGIIDAGEAGIAGNKLVLGATQVMNSQNISFSAGSVGVPASSEGTVSIGALGGSSALSASSSALEQNSSVNQAMAKNSLSTDLADDFIAKWLDVKVLSFDEEESPPNKKEPAE